MKGERREPETSACTDRVDTAKEIKCSSKARIEGEGVTRTLTNILNALDLFRLGEVASREFDAVVGAHPRDWVDWARCVL